ncbi:MAG TPA: hypothetical protein VFQ35_05360 [Polyangiaceae bacterium]|nr:hypothetical protein [Polyangiaceae bacterium]
MLSSDNSLLVLVALGVVVFVALLSVAWLASTSSRRRHEHLKRRFGPEYERAIVEYGSLERAERELIAREKRVKHLRLHDLSSNERARFSGNWEAVQARFVDDPSGAVQAAHELIERVMVARGYRLEDFDQRIADLSVEHAAVVQHYRAARVLADANREGRANTEELRQALVHYRVLFADLLAPPSHGRQQLKEARV